MTENSDTRCEARLSRRELEVLSLIAEGMSTREVARALWITEETVKSHVARVLARLGARTRAHAIAIVYRDGLWARSPENGNDERRPLV